MKVKKSRSYSAYTIRALRLMGQQINFTRREKAMTEENLAERVGISRGTLRKIEEGN